MQRKLRNMQLLGFLVSSLSSYLDEIKIHEGLSQNEVSILENVKAVSHFEKLNENVLFNPFISTHLFT